MENRNHAREVEHRNPLSDIQKRRPNVTRKLQRNISTTYRLKHTDNTHNGTIKSICNRHNWGLPTRVKKG